MLGRWHLEALLLSTVFEKLQEAWGSPGGIHSSEALSDNALTQIGWRFHKFLLYLSFGTNLFSLRWLRLLTLTSLQQDKSHLYPWVLENSLLSSKSSLSACMVFGTKQSGYVLEKQLWWSLHSTPWLQSREVRDEKWGCTTSGCCRTRTTCARVTLLAPWRAQTWDMLPRSSSEAWSTSWG